MHACTEYRACQGESSRPFSEKENGVRHMESSYVPSVASTAGALLLQDAAAHHGLLRGVEGVPVEQVPADCDF